MVVQQILGRSYASFFRFQGLTTVWGCLMSQHCLSFVWMASDSSNDTKPLSYYLSFGRFGLFSFLTEVRLGLNDSVLRLEIDASIFVVYHAKLVNELTIWPQKTLAMFTMMFNSVTSAYIVGLFRREWTRFPGISLVRFSVENKQTLCIQIHVFDCCY